MANICRSPMAEYLLRSLCAGRSPGNPVSIEIRSAGLMNTTGTDASDQALMVMRERGIDMSRHKARQVNDELVDWADLILCMEKVHLEAMQKEFPRAGAKMYLLTEYCGCSGDIIDPTGRNYRFFSECADQMEDLLEKLLDKLTAAASRS
jgi:protein-tyrosine phosphatase